MTLRRAVLGRSLVFCAAAVAAAFQIFLALHGTSRIHGGTEPVKAGPPANLPSVAVLDSARVLHLYLSEDRMEPSQASVPSGVEFVLVVHSFLPDAATLSLEGARPAVFTVAPGEMNALDLTLAPGPWRLSTGRIEQSTLMQVH